LSSADKKRIASLGGKARFQSLQAARRIADNFRYAAVLAELRGRPTRDFDFVDLLRLERIARAGRSAPGDAEDIVFLESRRKSSRKR
jgi:hypothetical protein